ncbi:MAG: lipopolysaccharide biosynthesis protein [Oscillospiraceae bacterium]|nr:lipopolysaccharide biosynthesis protein [Oscillospiraceae bacterium]
MNRKSVFSGLIWRFLERCGAQGVAFVVSVILARVLGPDIYGTVALVTVFTTILQVFVDSGMGNALIQKKDADDLDFSTVFYFNLAVCFILYALLFLCAPWIAKYYELPELTAIVRVMGLILIISGVRNVQQAYVSRHMLFKRFFFATLGSTIFAAVVGVVMAYCGFGIWALVAQNLLNLAISTAILWVTVKWRPKLCFSGKRLGSLFSFGWKLLVSSLLNTVYNEIRSLIIGKRYSSADLAFYNKGKQFPNLIVNNINTSIDSVLLPTLSANQDDRDRVRSMTRRAIKMSTFLMMPLMVGLAVCAEPLIRLLLTEKWLPSVFYMRIFCFTLAFHPIHTANLKAVVAMGRSDLNLILEIIKKVIGLSAVLITMWISVEAMAYSLLVISVLSQIINAWPNRKLLGYSYLDQLKDMLPQIALSCFMGAVVFCVTFLRLSDILTLLIQIPLGAVVYIAGSKLFGIDSFTYLLDVLKSFRRKESAKQK